MPQLPTTASLLSPSDILVIRRYVSTKYAPLPAERQADIVADAIRRTLERRIPDVPGEWKTRIADELIRRCLLDAQREVRPADVLDVCADIALPDPADEYLLLEPILRWMDERTRDLPVPERLSARLRELRPALPDTAALPAAAPVPLAGAGTAARGPRSTWAAVLLAAVVLGGAVTGYLLDEERQSAGERVQASEDDSSLVKIPYELRTKAAAVSDMPPSLAYRDIDASAVKAYLESRDSLLAEEPYFGAIVDSARAHGVHPLLLFAITGQEQGFVPRSARNAERIANNPFNVFHSWEDYNTDIADSADIAARTLRNRSKLLPEGADPFDWLNGTYAEDPNWAEGVRKLFAKLNSLQSAE